MLLNHQIMLVSFNKKHQRHIFISFSEQDIRFKVVRGVLHDVHYDTASETECRVLHHICQLASIRAATLASVGRL